MLSAFQALDSRSVPTVCAVLKVKKQIYTAIIPSGTTTGKNEAVELRDNRREFRGKGVLTACKNVELIAKKLPSNFYRNQQVLDNHLIALDGTSNKAKLGANALLSISLVAAKAAAAEKNLPLFSYFSQLSNNTPTLPLPLALVASGNKHGGNCTSFQEFMLLPVKFKTFAKCVQAVVEIYQTLGDIVKKKTHVFPPVDLEEGLILPTTQARPTLELVMQAIERAGYNKKVKLALDCAASEFYNEKTKKYNFEGKQLTSEKFTNVYFDLIEDFPIVSIEDPFDQEGWQAFSEFTRQTKVKVVGDDLLTTNPSRIIKGILSNACNVLLLKPNQIGTISETIESAQLARSANWSVIASHRSGDSEDTFLVDLAVGLGCEAAKIGGPARGERTSKYNRLLFIEKFHKIKLSKWVF